MVICCFTHSHSQTSSVSLSVGVCLVRLSFWLLFTDEDEDEDEGVDSLSLSLSVVSVFVLLARPMVERQHTVGERARITPTAQTGLERETERETDRRQRVSLMKGELQPFIIILNLMTL